MKELGRSSQNTHNKRSLIRTSHVCQRRRAAGRNQQVEVYKHTHTETSPLIFRANQWTDFYMITVSVMKELTLTSYSHVKQRHQQQLTSVHKVGVSWKQAKTLPRHVWKSWVFNKFTAWKLNSWSLNLPHETKKVTKNLFSHLCVGK